MLEIRMRVLRQFGALALMLTSCLTPAMACMATGAQMTIAERACCRTMNYQCEQMQMPASNGCCQKTPSNAYDNALDTKAVAFHTAAVPVVWLAAVQLVNPDSSAAGWVERRDYSPPKSPPSTISILRI